MKLTKIVVAAATPLVPLLRPVWVQHTLRRLGVRMPYMLARLLTYSGLVEFSVAGVPLVMRSYNTPIEITIFWKGLFGGREGAELQVWHDIISPDAVVFDVGANNGIYSLVASARTKQTVHAFEPVPAVEAQLLENVRLSNRKNITVNKTVVTDTDGIVTLYVPTTETGWTDVASLDADFAANRSIATTNLSCPAVTMDSYVAQLQLPDTTPLVCKIDVEGAEAKVLAGMQATLQRYNVTLLVELLDEPAFDACLNFIPTQYEVFAISPSGLSHTATKQRVPGAKNYLIRKK